MFLNFTEYLLPWNNSQGTMERRVCRYWNQQQQTICSGSICRGKWMVNVSDRDPSSGQRRWIFLLTWSNSFHYFNTKFQNYVDWKELTRSVKVLLLFAQLTPLALKLPYLMNKVLWCTFKYNLFMGKTWQLLSKCQKPLRTNPLLYSLEKRITLSLS